jgi:hydroxymethylpyrimidine/phosphomethylpyrimidine kinase
METPVAVTIAGSDNSGGAGIQADLKTFTYFKVYGQTVVTCIVAEISGQVRSIQPVDSGVIRDQLELTLMHFPVAAIKTGMLYSSENIDLICDAFETVPRSERPFLGEKVASLDSMREAVRRLYDEYRVPFLAKGGHLQTGLAIDLLVDSEGLHEYSEPYVQGVSTHGTGCAYSAAIAANVALGLSLNAAVGVAKKYITQAIVDSFQWNTGAGRIFALRHFWG